MKRHQIEKAPLWNGIPKNLFNQNIACEGQTEGYYGIFLQDVFMSNFEKAEWRPEQKRLYAKIRADIIIGLINEG